MVGFGGCWCAADLVVEFDAAVGAVCDAGSSVSVEYAAAEVQVWGEACAGGHHAGSVFR